MWEVAEHIKEEDLEQLAKNLNENLATDGIVVMSVTNLEHVVNGVRLHQTVKPKEWWVEKFRNFGLLHQERFIRFFGGQYVHGRNETGIRFHLVLGKSDTMKIPSKGLIDIARDLWFGSIPHRIIRKMVK